MISFDVYVHITVKSGTVHTHPEKLDAINNSQKGFRMRERIRNIIDHGAGWDLNHKAYFAIPALAIEYVKISEQ